MKILLMSMPDVAPIIIHEAAIHMPNHGIASIGGNVDEGHEVYLIDLVRKRNSLSTYLKKTLTKINPGLVGLSSMTWQYPTCLSLISFIKSILPRVKIVVGGYHATLMGREIAASPDSKDMDFMIRGEGEEAFRRLVNALEGADRLDAIPSLSYKHEGQWVHNDQGPLCDLSRLKLPIRDHRRLTGGYHFMYYKIEVLETSRGCTRHCNFCSISHMYGSSYRTYPIERILANLDYIYFCNRTRMVFITDDNMVLNPEGVMDLCDAIIQRNYKNLKLIVQADCISVADNEDMVRKMAAAGFRVIFLGLENVSRHNLRTLGKTDIVEASRRAVETCHRHGIMVIGGMIFGLPDDDEEAIRNNFQFFNDLGVDASYFQILTPYPKTRMREYLLQEGLVTNMDRYERYSGIWANVKTRKLEADRLQYAFWYYRQTALGWWKPSVFAEKQGILWTLLWSYMVKPVIKFFTERRIRRIGWEGCYEKYLHRLEIMNHFDDIKKLNQRHG